MPELTDCWAAAYHEAGHCVIANRNSDSWVASVILQKKDGKCEGTSDIGLKYSSSLTAVDTSIAGIAAEAQARAFGRHGSAAIIIADDETTSSILTYKNKS